MKMTLTSPFFLDVVFPYAQEEVLVEVVWDKVQEEQEQTKDLYVSVEANINKLITKLSEDLKVDETLVKEHKKDIKSLLVFQLVSMNTNHYYGTPTNEKSKKWLEHKFEVNDKATVQYHVEYLLYEKIKTKIKGLIKAQQEGS